MQVVREGMIDTMRPGGTGYQAAIGAPYWIAGKTGTAQVASRKGEAAVDPRNLPNAFASSCVYSLVLLLLIIRRLRLRLRSRAAGMVLALLARCTQDFDAWLLGKCQRAWSHLDSARGRTAIGLTSV